MLNFLLESGQSTGGGLGGTLILMVVVIIFFYLFMIRPQKKQEKKDAQMRDNLAVGDEVTTIGGIIGKVVSIKGETFVLETTKDRTKIRFLKGAIRNIDVKAQDLAAAVIEAKEAENATEAKAAETAEVATETAIEENAPAENQENENN